MSYSAYLLVTLVVFVGGGFKAFTSRPGQRLLAWAAEHLRRRALLVLVAALVFTTADLVGVAVFEPELERADNGRSASIHRENALSGPGRSGARDRPGAVRNPR